MECVNMVFQHEFDGMVDQYGLAIEGTDLDEDIDSFEYEPEQFPGCIFKIDGVSFLVFQNGKLIISGATNKENAMENFKRLKEIVDPFIQKRDDNHE